MKSFNPGDMVVLISGSMRMAVETVEEGKISTVWCHEGRFGRESFDARLLRKWEEREENDGPRGRSGPGGHRGDRGDRGHDRGDRGSNDRGGPNRGGKPGWDGKPREKKFFRKD